MTFTGGGIQLALVFDELVVGVQKVEVVAKYIKDEIARAPEIKAITDESFADVSKGQRLPGSYNWKSGYVAENGGRPVLAELYEPSRFFTDHVFSPIKTAELFDQIAAIAAVEKAEKDPVTVKYGATADALKDYSPLANIKRKAKITDIYNRNLQSHGSYTMISCPNISAHANGDAKPSAILITRPDGSEAIYCFRELKTFDVISVAMLVWNVGFPDAVSRLGEQYNVKVAWQPTKRKKVDDVVAAEGFDYTALS